LLHSFLENTMKNLQGMATQVGVHVAGWSAPASDVQQADLPKGAHFINTTIKAATLIPLALLGVALLLFASGMMANGALGGTSQMWIPGLLMWSIGFVLGWALFGKKK
jgi:hypothetical protein